jgi:regulator of replication initiation timing
MVSGLQVSIAASNRDVSDASADRECSELLRLERAVRALVAEHESLVAEHAALVDEHASLRSERDVLERKLDETMVDGRALEERLLAENQRRQDALKRVDELIGRLQPASIGAVAPQR